MPIALMLGGGLDARNRIERMGRAAIGQAAIGGRNDGLSLWLHAASVGEVEGVRPIVMALLADTAWARLVVTTMTVAGREAAERRLAPAAEAVLAPLDSPAIVRRFLRAVAPRLALIAETELWPNYFLEAHRAGARIAVVNGRISARTFARYLKVRSLIAQALACSDLVLTQTDADAERYRVLGARAERVIVAGSTKYDLRTIVNSAPLRAELQSFAAGRRLLVAGSTAPGEEEAVIGAYLALRTRFTSLALAIAPRHLTRVSAVCRLLDQSGLGYELASSMPASGEASATRPPVLLVDTMGELRALYGLGAVAFVGGSLAPGRGGQNPAEPAALGVPVLLGPFNDNHRELVEELLQGGGARLVRDASEIAAACSELLSDEPQRRRAGDAARRQVEQRGGAVETSLLHLRQLINLC